MVKVGFIHNGDFGSLSFLSCCLVLGTFEESTKPRPRFDLQLVEDLVVASGKSEWEMDNASLLLTYLLTALLVIDH